MPDESYDLSPADQRITELREQGLVDAEIAVRTGLPVAEVKARLARLRKRPATSAARLGAEGTAMGKRLLRRRTLLGGLAAAGVGAGAVAFGVALRAGRGGGSPAAGAGSPRPTSTRQPTAAPGRSVEVMVTTSAPTPQTDFPIAEVENPFEVVNFSPGERIEWSRGTFFMNPYSGEITGYRLPDEGPGEPLWFTRAEGDGRYVLATHGTAQGLGLLLERTTGRCWSWPGEELWLAASGYPFFLFMRPRGGGGPSGQYVIADQLLQKRAAFAIDEAYSPPTWVLEGGKAAALSGGPTARLSIVDLRRGAVTGEYEPPRSRDGRDLRSSRLDPGPDGTLLITSQYFEMGPKGVPAGDDVWLQQRVRWDGTLAGERASGFHPFESFSHDGKVSVREEQLGPPARDEREAPWPRAVVSTAAGIDTLSVRSAALRYGDSLPRNRWLADGSGFVALVRGSREDPDSGFGYAIISPAGDVERLPALPVAADRWYTQPVIAGPVPSPWFPNFLSFGRLYLYNREADSWIIPDIQSEGGPAHGALSDDIWAPATGEMVFHLPHGGHGGNPWPFLLDPVVQSTPSSPSAAGQMEFTVAGDSGCAALRERPDPGAGLIGCLSVGLDLSLAAEGEALWDGAAPARSLWSEGEPWVLVEAPPALRGWIRTEDLVWRGS